MRELIDPAKMTSLLSRRQLALNITVGVGALAFGLWLEKAPFPLNYQVMFVLAFVFALASLWHCMRIRIDEPCELPLVAGSAPKQTTNPWRSRRFLRVGFVAAVIHFAFFVIIPVTPLYLVNQMGASEGYMALFGMIELTSGALASIFAARVARKIGTRPMIASGDDRHGDFGADHCAGTDAPTDAAGGDLFRVAAGRRPRVSACSPSSSRTRPPTK